MVTQLRNSQAVAAACMLRLVVFGILLVVVSDLVIVAGLGFGEAFVMAIGLVFFLRYRRGQEA